MEKILILLSTYNGEKYLLEQLNSLYNQRNVDIFCLIRDDGSTDSTISVIRDYMKEHSISSFNLIEGDNVGCGNSFVKLLRYAYNNMPLFDYYAFCDQDDVWLDDKLDIAIKCLSLIERKFSPQLYVSNLKVVNSNLELIGLRFKKVNFSRDTVLVQNFSTGCTMVFNREMLELFVNRSPLFVGEHDCWFALLAIYLGELYYDPTPHILYRQHGCNVIGAKIDWKSNLKSKINSFRTLDQRLREERAHLFLNSYGEILSEEDKSRICVVSDYRKSLIKRLRFLFSLKVRMISFPKNIFLKIRICIGSV